MFLWKMKKKMKLPNDTFNSVKQLCHYYLLHSVTLRSTIENPMFPFLLVFFV